MIKVILFISLFILFSCNSSKRETYSPKQAFAELSKLTGFWEFKSNNIKISESWSKKNDSTYSGIGMFIKGDDTVSSETILLSLKGDSLYYIPSVSNQNRGQAVMFKYIEKSDTGFIFENKWHDFPQRIIYNISNSDTLVAIIGGKENGIYRNEYFIMAKYRNEPRIN